jgi:cephalosporin hydroxylase
MESLINNDTTDKNTCHSYLDTYVELMSPKQHTAKNVLEIGVEGGGSIQLWKDFFTDATIWGLDLHDCVKPVHDSIRMDNRIKLTLGQNAYTPDAIEQLSNVKFDFIIDDGAHTLESMIFIVHNYTRLLTDDGCLIIEDVQDINWIPCIMSAVPSDLKKYCKVEDLRSVKGRYDDIMFIIKKSS